ncbi:MAG: hypothetical protein ACTH31_16970, partial [Pseudoclavibacter sp.]
MTHDAHPMPAHTTAHADHARQQQSASDHAHAGAHDHAHDHALGGDRTKPFWDGWPTEPEAFWEHLYTELGGDQKWSGRANHVLTDIVSGLEPGSALDLGSGEGGDVIWLALQGWRATG